MIVEPGYADEDICFVREKIARIGLAVRTNRRGYVRRCRTFSKKTRAFQFRTNWPRHASRDLNCALAIRIDLISF